ncbi:DNA cross-link repair protein pso2/snm1 [Erysiphe necator]|nr:DNA cross-link repair protein pso2/snm1 [Erysiphe necator]
MFRNPRENLHLSTENLLKPSVGRPPTPTESSQTAIKYSPRTKNTLNSRRNMKTLSSAKKLEQSRKKLSVKITGKSNATILDFFKKVDAPVKEDSIFLEGGTPFGHRFPSPILQDLEIDAEENYDQTRFNEISGSVKRQRISEDHRLKHETILPDSEILNSCNGLSNENSLILPKTKANLRKDGPFFEDSDTDDEDQKPNSNSLPSLSIETAASRNKDLDNHTQISTKQDSESASGFRSKDNGSEDSFSNKYSVSTQENVQRIGQKFDVSNVKSESSQILGEQIKTQINELSRSSGEWEFFEDDEIMTDGFNAGEEFVGRRWIEEQCKFENEDETFKANEIYIKEPRNLQASPTTTICPVCNAELRDISETLFSKHVNECLDFSLTPKLVSNQSELAEIKTKKSESKSKFASKAAIPRPGQESPFEIEIIKSKTSSAFSKLMSGKVEEMAWANAAASDYSSKGKPAYQRTCPFYKIIPGFSICVDAFRYGAVKGCNAYFLSHFHSDHYIGLSSSWCHGPIYCSKVTANLVKQQLRVDARYVIPLEFDKKFRVPETPNVYVLMIPANHCPGSSLFLYEKVAEAGSSTRSQRVLHCGDFRACPAHISHPQLMPDVLDSVTNKYKHQIIDICYLDTTYLDPRYAFPPQEQVIQACADMCLSLKNEYVEEDSTLEVIRREHISSSISKFLEPAVRKASGESLMISHQNSRNRGRLLIVCGTYSIGKERICLGIARALNCKIFAPTRKMRICAALEDEELMSRMTNDPREAQIHLQMLMEIRAETLKEYLNSYKPYFSRVVGFRPSGWTYRPPKSRGTQTATIPQILNSPSWRSSFSLSDLVPQRGSTNEASCFGVPYSEHSSFRELTMFICALRIEKVIPTVNVGSAAGRTKMKGWIERWLAERRKNGPITIGNGQGEVNWC